MTDEYINQRLHNVGLIYNLDIYEIPTLWRTIVKEKLTDVEKERNKHISDNQSGSYPSNTNFETFLESRKLKTKDNIGLQYIEEFPIVITDRKLWLSICPSFEYSRKEGNKYVKKNIQDINVFYSDYLFLRKNVILELDSKFHDTEYKRLQDKARDKYILQKYNIDTVRIIGFGNNLNTDKCKRAMGEFIEKVENRTLYQKVPEINQDPVNFFKYKHELSIYIIEKYLETRKTPNTVVRNLNYQKILTRIGDNDNDRAIFLANYKDIMYVLSIMYP